MSPEADYIVSNVAHVDFGSNGPGAARTRSRDYPQLDKLKQQIEYLHDIVISNQGRIAAIENSKQGVKQSEYVRGPQVRNDQILEQPPLGAKEGREKQIRVLQDERGQRLLATVDTLLPFAGEEEVNTAAQDAFLRDELDAAERLAALTLLLRGREHGIGEPVADRLVTCIEGEDKGALLRGCLGAVRLLPVSDHLHERLALAVRQRLDDAQVSLTSYSPERVRVLSLCILVLGDFGVPADTFLLANLLQQDEESRVLGQITPALWQIFLRDPSSYPDKAASQIRKEAEEQLMEFTQKRVIRDWRFFSRASSLLTILCFRLEKDDLDLAFDTVRDSQDHSLAQEMMRHIGDAREGLERSGHLAWASERESDAVKVLAGLKDLASNSLAAT